MTCTYTNTQNAATITVTKDAVPNDPQDFAYTTTGTGGGTFGSGFSLDDDADATLPNTLTFTFTGADATGTKTITETLPVTGWTLTNLVCSKGTTTLATGLASIALLPGDAVTCTYTNTQNASLDIEKQSVGGTATFDYTVTGTGLAPFTRDTAVANPTANTPFAFTGLQLGTKDVVETPEPGFTLTGIVCTANGAVITIGTGSGAGFAQGATAGFDPGDTTVRAVVAAGNTPTCTYTNTADATITVTKDAVPNDPQDFAYTTTGTGGGTLFQSGTFLLDDDADATLPATRTFTFTGADATGTKTITETLPVTGWTLTNLVCSKGTTTLATGLASIALLPGDAVTCTYTNTQNAATITVTKDAVPNDPQDFAYTTTGTGGGTFGTGFSLDDDADATLPNTLTFTFTGADATGTKTITETPAGHRLDADQPRLLEGHDHPRHRPRQHRPAAR